MKQYNFTIVSENLTTPFKIFFSQDADDCEIMANFSEVQYCAVIQFDNARTVIIESEILSFIFDPR